MRDHVEAQKTPRSFGFGGSGHGDASGLRIGITPRTDAGPAAACAAGLRPPPTRPAAWEASVGGV